MEMGRGWGRGNWGGVGGRGGGGGGGRGRGQGWYVVLCGLVTSLKPRGPDRSSQSSGAVLESRWPSWAFRHNETSGFRGRKATLNRAHALVSACPWGGGEGGGGGGSWWWRVVSMQV